MILKHAIPMLKLGTLGTTVVWSIDKLDEYARTVSNEDLLIAKKHVGKSRKKIIWPFSYGPFYRSEAFVALKSECSRRIKENIFIEKTPERTVTYRRNLPKCFRQPIAP